MAPSAEFKTSAPSSTMASGKRSLNAIIKRTPAAKGVPYFINFAESFSLLSKNSATERESRPAAKLAATTINKSIINNTFFIK